MDRDELFRELQYWFDSGRPNVHVKVGTSWRIEPRPSWDEEHPHLVHNAHFKIRRKMVDNPDTKIEKYVGGKWVPASFEDTRNDNLLIRLAGGVAKKKIKRPEYKYQYLLYNPDINMFALTSKKYRSKDEALADGVGKFGKIIKKLKRSKELIEDNTQ